MNSREKKILIAIVLVMLYAVGDWVYSTYMSTGSIEQNAATAQGEVARAKELAQSTSATLKNLRENSQTLRLLTAAETPIAMEPLGEPPWRQLSNNSAMNVNYSGFIEIGSDRVAILSGQEYREGEQLKETGEFVKKIREKSVTLVNRVTGKQREIAYLGQ